jgi:hypothetical protein
VVCVVRCWPAAGALALLLGVAMSARAAVTATGDPADRYGVSPSVFTVDPFDAMYGGPPTPGHNAGITAARQIKQTFKNATTFNVGQINFSFDVTGGSTVGSAADTGIKLAFYEVDDVGASAWSPGDLVKEITLQPGNMPGSNEVFRLDLTGGDVFTLPQRDAGTNGYGVVFSTPNELSSDGNPGTLWFTDVSMTDFYADGRYHPFNSTSSSTRDIGLSLVASAGPVCDPGDVNCADGVDEVDLGIIAAHFRQNGSREEGDLTGNGYVDFDDFGQWKQYYTGPGLGSDAFAFLSVPEPGSTSLLLVGVAGLLTGVRRRRRASSPA